MIARIIRRFVLSRHTFVNSVSSKLYTRYFSKDISPIKHLSINEVKHQDKIDELGSFVPLSVVKQYLLRLNIIFAEGPTCISTNCPMCHSSDTFFINKISGCFICSNCKRSGNWNFLELYLSNPGNKGDVPVDEAIAYGKNNWLKLSSNTVKIDEDLVKSGLLKNFHIPLSTLNDLNVRVSEDGEKVYFPLMYGLDSVGYITLKDGMVEETFPFKNAKGVLIKKNKRKSALIVSSLQDFLALLTTPLACDIICLPHGQEKLPQEILPLFEEYNKLILWFNNNSLSWGNMKMFAKKLLNERCSLVQPTDSQPSPYNCIRNGKDILDILKNAQEVYHASIITFANLREDVLSELYNADKVSGVKWERFPALNTILKGHRRGELTILTGPTGSGKTTFMSEYSLDLVCNKVTTLWGSFEIRNQRLARTMMTQMFSAPLEKNLDKFDEWADKFERLPLYFMTFHGQQPLDIVMDAVKHATYVHDVVHVIIDNVQFMLGLSNSESGFLDRFYRQDALIAGFRNFATTFNCHVTLVIHPRKEKEAEQLSANSIFGGAKAAQEADNILIIQHKTSHSSMRTRKYLQVAKNRFSGDLGIMPLEFDKEALSFRNKKQV